MHTANAEFAQSYKIQEYTVLFLEIPLVATKFKNFIFYPIMQKTGFYRKWRLF